MHWTDEAIVLSSKKYGESNAVARLFAREHGVFAGIARGVTSKTGRGVVQPGNVLLATWNARLSEHLGTWRCELLEAGVALIMQDADKLSALASACALIESALPERHPYPKFYEQFKTFLDVLKDSDSWPEAYVRLELALLAESGFGLDLKACAATGATSDLIYVSPKSGRAVSAQAGEPYKEKLLPLPEFLLTSPSRGEVARRSRAGGGDHPSHLLIPKARELREHMMEAEKQLWYHLRAHRFKGYGFRRQHSISTQYIVDFVCLDKKLVIELDGGQHTESQEYDAKRTAFLEQEGYQVLRFWNNEVFENMDGVLNTLWNALNNTPSLTLPPQGGGEIKAIKPAEILAGMQLTGYFLDHWLLEPHGKKLPAARLRLMETIKEDAAETT